MGTESKKPRIFERGQIWHWDDPIFETKDKNIKIVDGESTQRYSRYVLVIQATETIEEPDITDIGDDKKKKTTPDIMVIPMTSTDKGIYSVPVTIYHGYKKSNISYAYVLRRFAADAKQLSNYQCRLSDSDMRKIEQKILELDGISKVVERVVEKNLEIKSSFYKKLSDSSKSIIPEIKPVTKNEHETSLPFPEPNDIHEEAINNEQEILNAVAEATTVETTTRRGGRKKTVHTKRYMQSFVDDYKADKEKCAKKYNYASSSAYKCYLKYKKELQELEEAENESGDSSSVSDIPNTDNISDAVSNISNRLRDEIKKVGFAKYLNSVKNKVWNSDFYQELQNMFYFSFIEMLSLKSYNGKISSITIDGNSLHLPTFKFLDMYWNDERIRELESFEDVVKEIQKEGGFIEKEFVNVLNGMIAKKLGLSFADRKRVCDYVKRFCA